MTTAQAWLPVVLPSVAGVVAMACMWFAWDRERS